MCVCGGAWRAGSSRSPDTVRWKCSREGGGPQTATELLHFEHSDMAAWRFIVLGVLCWVCQGLACTSCSISFQSHERESVFSLLEGFQKYC